MRSSASSSAHPAGTPLRQGVSDVLMTAAERGANEGGMSGWVLTQQPPYASLLCPHTCGHPSQIIIRAHKHHTHQRPPLCLSGSVPTRTAGPGCDGTMPLQPWRDVPARARGQRCGSNQTTISRQHGPGLCVGLDRMAPGTWVFLVGKIEQPPG